MLSNAKTENKKIEKFYYINEISNMNLELHDTFLKCEKNTISIDDLRAIYNPKEKIIHECSICKLNKKITYIEGITRLSNEDGLAILMQKQGLYHQKYLLLCDSCSTARKI